MWIDGFRYVALLEMTGTRVKRLLVRKKYGPSK